MALTLTYQKDIQFLPVGNEFLLSKLKNQVLTETVTIKNSYVKIVTIEGTKNNIKFSICIYDNANKENLLERKEYSFNPDITDKSANFIKQGYLYLKSLDEFAEAKDC